MALTSPDCIEGKHGICNGYGWDEDADQLTTCPCACHPDDDGEAAARQWAEAHGYELVDVRPVGTRTARQAFALGEHR